MTLDFTTDHGKVALRQLENEVVIWLTTVTPSGTPQPNPVWFTWDGEDILIWVQPTSARIRNLASNPKVSLHFGTDPEAHHITVITGTAEVDKSIGSFTENEMYMSQYDAGMWERAGMTVETAAQEFSVPLRIRPDKLRGY